MGFSGGGGGGGSGAGVGGPTVPYDTPENHGAKRDGVTDDTAAIQAAIQSAVNLAIASNYYAEVWFQEGIYQVNGALQQGGANLANAQITLPINGAANKKITLALRGTRNGAGLAHWQQTVPPATGSLIRSGLTGATYSGTYGSPSIIGGPTGEQGYGTTGAVFSNMLLIVDGLTIMGPANPSCSGLFLYGIAEADIRNLGVHANQVPSSAALPTNGATGLVMPVNGNNDFCEIGDYSCEGFLSGIRVGEHSSAKSIRCLYCQNGIVVGGTNPHSIHIAYASVEACVSPIYYAAISPVQAYSAPFAPITIDHLDIENGVSPFTIGNTIEDPTNNLSGEIWLNPNSGAFSPTFNGATKVHVRRTDVAPGAVAAPGVPATTVAYRNVFGRDAVVQVNGGTVTVIAVDGTATGLTNGTVIVPSYKNITLTYSVAPTWNWVLI